MSETKLSAIEVAAEKVVACVSTLSIWVSELEDRMRSMETRPSEHPDFSKKFAELEAKTLTKNDVLELISSVSGGSAQRASSVPAWPRAASPGQSPRGRFATDDWAA